MPIVFFFIRFTNNDFYIIKFKDKFLKLFWYRCERPPSDGKKDNDGTLIQTKQNKNKKMKNDRRNSWFKWPRFILDLCLLRI